MSSPILKSFTFVPQPKVSNDPGLKCPGRADMFCTLTRN